MRMIGSVVVAAAVAFSVVSAGCGGGSGGGEATGCGEFQPCGGDPVGTWKLSAGCVTAAGLAELADPDCPNGTTDITDLELAGTLTFKADGTFTINGLSMRTTYELGLPLECVAEGSCEAKEATLQSNTQLQSATCSGTDPCTCTATSVNTSTGETGQYSVYNHSLVLDGFSSLGSGGPFCIEGNRLHLITPSYDGNAVSRDFVAVRQ